MSKAEMAVHHIKPDSLRFERQNLSLDEQSRGGQFTVVDLICESESSDEFRLKMFMDETLWHTPVSVDLGGIKIKGVEPGLSAPVRVALEEHLEHLDDCRDDASAHGRLDEMQSCLDRTDKVRLLLRDVVAGEGGADDGAQDQEQEQG